MRIRTEDEKREQKLREEMESTLELKDRQISEVMSRMRDLQENLDEARKAVPDMKDENAHLSKERDRLQSEVERQRILVTERSNLVQN